MISVSREYAHIENKLNRLAATDRRAYIGMEHELRLAYPLMKASRLACYHNVKGYVNERRFEVDILLLLPPRNVLLVEVKSYKGLLSQATPSRWRQDKQDGSAPVLLKDPFWQSHRTQKLFSVCLGRFASRLNIVSCVVMTGQFQFVGSLRDSALVLTQPEFIALVNNYLSSVPVAQKKVSPEILAAACCLASDGIEPLFFDNDWFFGSS